ncbi:MAG: SDR family NAD(P)-dependent oxidoreductase, partial [Pseudomonadota bacterium]
MNSRRNVLVTGASKGIGAAVALAFARNGDNVCVNFNGDREGAETTVAACCTLGVDAIAVAADVSDRTQVQALFEKCEAGLGPVRCLVNNAGVIGGQMPIDKLSTEALRTCFSVNVFGSFFTLSEAAQRMPAHGGGSVVNMSSVAAELGSPGEYVHYAASKGAIETLTVGAGKELAAKGIRV